MTLLLLAYLAGVLTILSPCILPVLPFVFARTDRPFRTNGLPLLAGMALAFTAVATLAAVGGGWVVAVNQTGRGVALAALALFGATLLWPPLAGWLTRPLVALGARLAERADAGRRAGSETAASLLLGVATGLLWAPCAGPVLGLILTGAALEGASVGASLLLLVYALGAASSLAAALLIGGRVLTAMTRGLGLGEGLRRGLGVAVLAGVAVTASGLDTSVLARLSQPATAALEQGLLNRLGRPALTDASAAAMTSALPVEGRLPPLDGATLWLNSPPLTPGSLRGKVVLIDFWTYSCINCLRALPHVQAWARHYREAGLVVIGVHAPEFAFERDPDHVRRAVRELGIDYPVALDNDYGIWRAFDNRYWPAHYVIDADGRIRHHHFGEGEYDETEQVIRQLLAEAGTSPPARIADPAVAGQGAEVAADPANLRSPETYLGHARAENMADPGGIAADRSRDYTLVEPLPLNHWSLGGAWTVGAEHAAADRPGGRIAFRFHARDLHLVLAPAATGAPIPFRVRLDGQPPGANHGADLDADGRGTISGHRLYQLIRQTGPIRDRTFEIEFDAPGAQAFAFTFG